ncbi:MAG: rhomboid family intramembrane serine protease [Bacteroidetes bacterium]|nr:MAG: rhomboid family intramembrane serine protease [Bacteroidota bacterium]
MGSIGYISILLLLANTLVTYQGLNDRSFFDRYSFQIDGILIRKEYYRIISSGFLHVDWRHFILNMLTFYFFSYALEVKFGHALFLLLYFGSLAGGNLLALYIHRNHGDYHAVGASGAISGLIFASIAVFPGLILYLIFFPIPGWLFGLIYVLASIYGIKSQSDNIGHEAHLGGGLAGMLTAVSLDPYVVRENYFEILCILVPSAVFLYLLMRNPDFLLVNRFSFPGSQQKFYNKDEKYNYEQNQRKRELDRLLDKISRSGIGSLSAQERKRLDELNK